MEFIIFVNVSCTFVNIWSLLFVSTHERTRKLTPTRGTSGRGGLMELSHGGFCCDTLFGKEFTFGR